MRSSRTITFLATLLLLAGPTAARESFEFVSEHLPETAIDNRYGSLPLATHHETLQAIQIQAASTLTDSQQLEVSGHQLALSYQRPLRDDLTGQFILFNDRQSFSGGNTDMPLKVLFSKDVPLSLPAEARFGSLEGDYEHRGFGLFLGREYDIPKLGQTFTTAGILWEELTLTGYQMPYEILSGASAGATGIADYSGRYTFITPMLQLAQQYHRGLWRFTPTLTFAIPLPRRGVQGRITGDGFDISGDTADVGNGTHYGDPSMTLGLLAEYRPWHLSLDVGELISQALLEPLIHKGIETNRVISVRWSWRW